MAIWIVKNSGKISYGIKRYLCDTLEDLPYSENGEVVIPGSKAYVISEKKTYMMGSDEEWHEINEGSGSGASSMSQLTDVDLTNLENGQVLKYDEDTQTWKPGDDASATSLGNLDDVDLTNLQDGQVIIYDSTTEKWLASDIPSDIAEVTQAQYDALPSETKNLPIIYQISDKGYFFYKGKKFRASKELTQAEYDQLTPEEQNDGTEYFITDAPETVAELTQAQYDVLTPDKKNNGTIWQISNKGYFYYKNKQFRASRELTQAEFDALPTSVKNNGTEYLITDATTSIGDIDDVNITSLTDGEVLAYDSTAQEWVNSPNVFAVRQENDYIAFDATSAVPSRYFGCKLGELDANNDTFTGLNINDINDKSFACTAYIEVSKGGYIYEVQPIACSASLMGPGGASMLRGDPIVAIEQFIDDAGSNYNRLTLIIFLPKSASDYYRLEIVATTSNPVLTATVTTVTNLYT